jgi:hypothetical protein
MRKVCKKHGVKSWMWDPFVVVDEIMPTPFEYDAVIVMTPHSNIDYVWSLNEFRPDCIIVDLWKVYAESKLSNTGIYKVGDML